MSAFWDGESRKPVEDTALIGFVLYIFAQLETHEPTDFNLFAQLADILADDVLHQAIRVAHPRLLVEAGVGEEFFELAIDDLSDDVLGFARTGRLRSINLTFLRDHVFGQFFSPHG